MPPRKTTKRPAAKVAASSTKKKPADSECWEEKTVSVLRDCCKKRSLDSKGTKDTLIKRLTEYEQQEEEDEEVVSTPPKLTKQDSENTLLKKAFQSLKQEPQKKIKRKPDDMCDISASVEVYEDYDCMLNQTNINANNNKFYVIQILKNKSTGGFYCWSRWGRVGEPGQIILKGPLDLHSAVSEFRKKFKDKTRNDWDNRANFVARSGKYTLLEMDEDDEEEEEEQEEKPKTVVQKKADLVAGKKYAPCSLEPATKSLVELLFDDDMFKSTMAAMDLDVKKMPLGKLSKAQIAKGFDALVAIEDAIKEKKPLQQLESLCSTFFTLIPHSFGRQRPPLLSNMMLVQAKKDMLLVLSDIELAQSLQKDKKSVDDDSTEKLDPHPMDEKYELLNCNLSLLPPSSKEHKIIQTYINNTRSSATWKNQNIWKVDRNEEGKRFERHENIDNRKLLWHGTNVAVVAAILNSGLRIMPHSGGRVGSGIYFASENGKSRAYVQCAGNGTGIMFLNEVALGKEKTITMDDCSLKAAPIGYDSVVARGHSEPDPKLDATIELDGKKVVVPQGAPVATKYKTSSFSQSEYLVYLESQARIRYLITFNEK